MDPGLAMAGLGVGLLVGLTGMGAGSLMTPILITVFGEATRGATGSGPQIMVDGMNAAFAAATVIAALTFAVALTFRRQEQQTI